MTNNDDIHQHFQQLTAQHLAALNTHHQMERQNLVRTAGRRLAQSQADHAQWMRDHQAKTEKHRLENEAALAALQREHAQPKKQPLSDGEAGNHAAALTSLVQDNAALREQVKALINLQASIDQITEMRRPLTEEEMQQRIRKARRVRLEENVRRERAKSDEARAHDEKRNKLVGYPEFGLEAAEKALEDYNRYEHENNSSR